MAKGLYHSQESAQSVPAVKCRNKEVPGSMNCGIQDGGRSVWTFQTLLSAVAAGDAQPLYECISQIERRVREAEKIFGPPRSKRTRVLEGLRNFVAAHGLQLTAAQIREYRKSSEGKRAAMIYLS